MPIETTGIRDAIRRFGTADAELRAELTPATLEAADVVAAQIRSNYSWSPPIAGSVSTSASFSATGGGAVIRIPERDYPHAGEVRTFEGNGVSPTPFEQPVYGHKDRSVTKMTRPSIGPGVRDKRPEAVAIIAAAVHKAFN